MRITTRAEITVALSAALWGLFWLPLRTFEQYGLTPTWVTLSQFIAPLILLIPLALLRRTRHQASGIAHFDSGLLVGAGFVLYCESILLTEVARTLILFYTMPVWGALIEVGLMGRRFTHWRGLALVLGMAGLLIMLGVENLWAARFNLGDALALLSSIVFTFGVMRIRQKPQIPVFEQLFAFFFYGGIIALGFTWLPLTELGAPPDLAILHALLPWIALIAIGFLLPTMIGVYWGSRWVDPGRLGVLLQLEVVVGLTSAAILANEPFGWREGLGGLLVICAGLVEIFGNRPDSRPSLQPSKPTATPR